MRELSIDIETYSSADLPKCGVYKYVEAPDFGVLLFGYALDDEPVKVIDLTEESIPADVVGMLLDPAIVKTAWNANFERTCLAKHLQQPLPPEQWQCTAVHAATLGLPRTLEQAGKLVGLPEDAQKMKVGKALISYFCKPCKPTKSNGQRTRNLPCHDVEKWNLFIEYNRRDVEVERNIRRIMEKFPLRPEELEAYWIDQRVNDRGIRIDQKLADEAIRVAKERKAALTAEAAALTGLENVNSVSQLKQWLGVEGALDKNIIADLRAAGGLDETADRVLEIRQENGKASVSKYEAMKRSVCKDERVHGVLQFYGAPRTGRWAGKLVQVQNLPQNQIPDLDAARSLLQNGDADMIEMCYGSLSMVLSQLVRTAFIGGEGKTFVVADYSAIEARVLAWLADERWRMDLFAKGGDIYCQSASAMFHVPVEKHGVNGHLRQKGKIAELACIAAGQKVLTEQGLVPIERVTKDMRVWDGAEWVRHDGVVCRGVKEVISYGGLTATGDHIVWIDEAGEPKQIRFEYAASCGAHLLQTGDGRNPVRLGRDYQPGETLVGELEQMPCVDPLQGLWQRPMDESLKPDPRHIERLPKLFRATEVLPEMAGQALHSGEAALHEPEGRGIPELWGPRDPLQLSERERRLQVYDQCAWSAGARNGTGQDRCERELRAGEPALGDTPAKLRESASISRKAYVYDILNAGPRHRFTVSNVLVHNCGYGGSVPAMINMGALRMGLKEEELKPIVDAWRESNPEITKFWWLIDTAVNETVATRQPDWRMDLPHGLSMRYTKNLLHIRLPSGRELRYWKPQVIPGKFDRENLAYWGINEGRWMNIRSYGPKVVENIVQAIARDCLRDAMTAIHKAGLDIVMHVHDEVIVEAPKERAEEVLQQVLEIMRTPIPWAPGLLLKGEGYITDYYKKD